MKQSSALTVTLILITTAVGGATIWVACNFVDSLHNSVQATKKIHITEDTKIPERGKFDAISPQFSQQIESMTSSQNGPTKTQVLALNRSELLYDQAMKAISTENYAEACDLLTKVLKLIPVESKNYSQWFADGKSRDKKIYLAMTYQLRSFCYLNRHQYQEAIADLDQAIALRPAYGPNFTNRGKAHLLLGHREQGKADLKRAKHLPVGRDGSANEHALDELADHY